MNLLLDTCTFLWIVLDPARLSATASQAYTDPANTCWLSVVSAWEIAVKYGLGQIVLQMPPDQFVPQQRTRHGIGALSLEEAEALHVPLLPQIHKDPFDRMLVCQALVHSMTIVTPDPLIRLYPVPTLW